MSTRRKVLRFFGVTLLIVLAGLLVYTRIRPQAGISTISQASLANADDEFRPQVVIPNPFPPITKFPVVKASETVGKVSDRDLVLGVVVNGAARAYPINVLTGPTREIINDNLGGRAIAATW